MPLSTKAGKQKVLGLTSAWASWRRSKLKRKLLNPQLCSRSVSFFSIARLTIWSLANGTGFGCCFELSQRWNLDHALSPSRGTCLSSGTEKTCIASDALIIRHMNDASEKWEWFTWSQLICGVTQSAAALLQMWQNYYWSISTFQALFGVTIFESLTKMQHKNKSPLLTSAFCVGFIFRTSNSFQWTFASILNLLCVCHPNLPFWLHFLHVLQEWMESE